MNAGDTRADTFPPVVLNLGGSVLMPERPSAAYLVEVAAAFKELAASGPPLYVVVGGGHTARRYISLAREAGALTGQPPAEPTLDELGIAATRLNARLLATALGTLGLEVPAEPPTDVETAARLGRSHACVVMGGTIPGHTTDAVAALLAREVGARRLVVATNVEGVYTADPRNHPEAQLLAELSFNRLIEIVGTATGQAGINAVVDPVATRLAAKIEGLELAVVSGADLANLAAACRSEPFEGSLVRG